MSGCPESAGWHCDEKEHAAFKVASDLKARLFLLPPARRAQMLGSASASVWDFLARSGPEDGLRAVPLGRDSSGSLTGGQDWGITREGAPAADLYYKDFSETQRFISMVESNSCVGPRAAGPLGQCGRRRALPAPGTLPLRTAHSTPLAQPPFARCPRARACRPENQILTGLRESRNLCAQTSFALEVRGAARARAAARRSRQRRPRARAARVPLPPSPYPAFRSLTLSRRAFCAALQALRQGAPIKGLHAHVRRAPQVQRQAGARGGRAVPPAVCVAGRLPAGRRRRQVRGAGHQV